MPAEIGFPIVQWRALEHVVSSFEEFRLLHIDVARLDQLDVFEIITPFPIRCQLLQIGLRHFVIILLRIAQLDACPGGFGELRFEGKDLLCVIGGRRGRLTQKRQHLRDMIDILSAQFFRSLVRLCVIITVW